MLCMCRGTDDERSTVYVGLRSGVVQAFDCMERRFTVEYDATGGVGTLVGVAKHKRYTEYPTTPPPPFTSPLPIQGSHYLH